MGLAQPTITPRPERTDKYAIAIDSQILEFLSELLRSWATGASRGESSKFFHHVAKIVHRKTIGEQTTKGKAASNKRRPLATCRGIGFFSRLAYTKPLSFANEDQGKHPCQYAHPP
jgi:hypothetical protein